MEPSDVTHPDWIKATCIECETTRRFVASHGDKEQLWAAYECPECGHYIVLSLDPGHEPTPQQRA